MLKKMEKQMRGMKSRYYNVVPPKVLYDVKLILIKCLSMSVHVSLSGVVYVLNTRWQQIKQYQNSKRTRHSRAA